jgi:hypothetical protein
VADEAGGWRTVATRVWTLACRRLHRGLSCVACRETDDYFAYTLTPQSDLAKISLNLPLSVPIFKLAYTLDGTRRHICVYPTLQFLYSHHIQARCRASNPCDPYASCEHAPVLRVLRV